MLTTEKIFIVCDKENGCKIESVWTSERKANLHASGLNLHSLNSGGDPLRWDVKRHYISK